MPASATTSCAPLASGTSLWPTGKEERVEEKDAHSLSFLRQMGADKGRTYELEQCTVKCMRGILFCYMRQSDKVSIIIHRLFCSHKRNL